MALGLRRRWRESRTSAGEGQSGPAGRGEAPAEHFSSHLLALLFESHAPGAALSVLDVGPAAGQTVTFLSRYQCRLHYADLYDEPALLGPCEPGDLAARTRQLRGLLGEAGRQAYDICLFWDLFRCIHESALPAFDGALAAVVSHRTLAHAFLCHGRVTAGHTSIPARRFAIIHSARVSQRPCTGPPLPLYNLPQREVLDRVNALEVDKSRLLQGGLLEVLLKARDLPTRLSAHV